MILPLLWIMFGVASVAFGVRGLRCALAGGYQNGHTHRCEKCGAVWWHKPLSGDASAEGWPTARAAVDAHTCPKCGAEQFEIDRVGPPPVAAAPAVKTPVNTSGRAPTAAGGSVAAGTASPATAGGLGREPPAPSPKDRDTADHGAGAALPSKEPAQ